MYYFININIFYYCIFLYVYMRIINIPKGKAMIHIRMQAYFLHMMHIYIYSNKAHVFTYLIDSLKHMKKNALKCMFLLVLMRIN